MICYDIFLLNKKKKRKKKINNNNNNSKINKSGLKIEKRAAAM